MFELKPCPKKYTADLDKAALPEETVARVRAVLAAGRAGILAETRRVDTGRLGIPVFMSMCGPAAAEVMPVRKQMGKGASPAQAEASALMELVERYSFFSFFQNQANFETLCWSEAAARWPAEIVAMDQILASVSEDLDPKAAVRVMDLVSWRFCPALDLSAGRRRMVPLDWFRKLNEYNGSSAGNSFEESLLQGACELVERHVCALFDRDRPVLPTLDSSGFADPVLRDLCARFKSRGIRLALKDFSMGLPVPTVAALAFDPGTFPALSEIVFTAGTASSPVKAAIRAVTEVAQLAGDFETGQVYEPSGLPKLKSLDQAARLEQGPVVGLDALPCLERDDILEELVALGRGLRGLGYNLFSVDISHADLGIPANYSFAPGFRFRERTGQQSLGLFVGRILAEEAPVDEARAGLCRLAGIYPKAPFLPFFQGLLALRLEDPDAAAARFAEAEAVQPEAQERAMAAFYRAYALTREGDFEAARPCLDRAVDLDCGVKEYFNLRGVCLFKQGLYEEAAGDFEAAVGLDKGSASDLANLGLCHKFMGRRQAAVEYLSLALDLDAGLEYARRHLDELLADRVRGL
ncbi:MAG: YcaO-like family protein [Desulfovibrionaceae bacterium]|nr:YcaO-like family protein [Desulfovibrionaceae bacterium]